MKAKSDESEILAWAGEVLTQESLAILQAKENLGPAFVKAVQGLLSCTGKAVVTGLGKSGHIARKTAATLASTGTPATYLHPSEALHGDLGLLKEGDWLIAIAFGGETWEVLEVVKYARRLGMPVIAITGQRASALANLADHLLDGSIEREACPMNLAPTSSSTVALALGDALAVSVMRARGFVAKDFAGIHPGGSLGRRLSLVKDHMHTGENLPQVSPEATFHDVLEAVTRKNYGIAAVLAADGSMLGAISDGDLRRILLKVGSGALSMQAREFMNTKPKVIAGDRPAVDAILKMEESRITSLFVFDQGAEESSPAAEKSTFIIGIIRMHDLLAAKIV